MIRKSLESVILLVRRFGLVVRCTELAVIERTELAVIEHTELAVARTELVVIVCTGLVPLSKLIF